jgi:integrase
MSPDTLTRTFNTLVAVSGLPPVRLHDLRHGAGSLALQAGVDLKVVQDQLGHASIVLTADTYVTVVPQVAHAAAEEVARLLIDAARHPARRRRRRHRTARVTATARQLVHRRRP